MLGYVVPKQHIPDLQRQVGRCYPQKESSDIFTRTGGRRLYQIEKVWEEVRKRLARLRRAECIRKCTKRKQKEQDNFPRIPLSTASTCWRRTSPGSWKHLGSKCTTCGVHVPKKAKLDITPPKISKLKPTVKKAKIFISTRVQWSPLQVGQELSQGTQGALATIKDCL